MFTGIVEEVGTVAAVRRAATGGAAVEIAACKVLEGTAVGDSIAVEGVCLTVTAIADGRFTADAMPETLRRSTLGALRAGDRVNLERALTLSSRLGGHIVSGHIDARGRISEVRPDANAVWITVEASPEVLRYVVEKGSIAIDGVSLTVACVSSVCFKVSVIPHTRNVTTLLSKRVGAEVNLENDILAKYIEKLCPQPHKGGLMMEALERNGFL